MTPEKTSERVEQLDGLRGLAILLVILNHLRLDVLYQLVPSQLHFLVKVLNTNGKVAVGVLFVLSGYLMATLYPVVLSKISFWQKRYTRIFPAFLAMCSSLAIVRFFWGVSPSYFLVIVPFVVMLLGGGAWKLIRSYPNRKKLGRVLFLGFLTFQVLAVVGYLILQQKVPAPVFYQVWPAWLRQIVFWLVNATMTLPFGEYVPQLDGVYWSVTTEVLFYLLYPVAFLPFVHLVKTRKSPKLTVLLLGAAFPFFYGLTLLFRNILGLHILEIYLTMYFLTGIALSHVREVPFLINLRKKIVQLPAPLLVFGGLFLLMGLPIFIPFVDVGLAGNALYWIPAVAVMFWLALRSDNSWSKFLSHKLLLHLGTWSYSLYLTHTLAIELFANWIPASSPLTMILSGTGAVALMALLSATLHHLLERPYFVDRIPSIKKKLVTDERVTTSSSSSSRLRAVRPVLVMCVVGALLVWIGYKVPAPLTAQVVTHQNSSLKTLSVVTAEALSIPFSGAENNLGMIFLHLKPLSDKEVRELGYTRGPDDMTSLQVQVLNEKGEEVGKGNYPLFQIFESRFHPIGIPIDPASQGKIFSLVLQASHARPDRFIAVVNKGNVALRTVYFPNKKELLTQPQKLVVFVATKLVQPFQESETQYIILLSLPLLLLLGLAAVQTTSKTDQKTTRKKKVI